jgi:hypothetical protein
MPGKGADQPYMPQCHCSSLRAPPPATTIAAEPAEEPQLPWDGSQGLRVSPPYLQQSAADQLVIEQACCCRKPGRRVKRRCVAAALGSRVQAQKQGCRGRAPLVAPGQLACGQLGHEDGACCSQPLENPAAAVQHLRAEGGAGQQNGSAQAGCPGGSATTRQLRSCLQESSSPSSNPAVAPGPAGPLRPSWSGSPALQTGPSYRRGCRAEGLCRAPPPARRRRPLRGPLRGAL